MILELRDELERTKQLLSEKTAKLVQLAVCFESSVDPFSLLLSFSLSCVVSFVRAQQSHQEQAGELQELRTTVQRQRAAQMANDELVAAFQQSIRQFELDSAHIGEQTQKNSQMCTTETTVIECR